MVNRVRQVQDFLGRQILLENVSSYVTYRDSTMSEWEFLAEVAKAADCLILFDVNNVYVSAFNHQFDPLTYLQAMPIDRVQQFHLAGHQNLGDFIVDTHDASVIDNVWKLYVDALKRFGRVSTLLERDDNIPPLAELVEELSVARRLADQVLNETVSTPLHTQHESL